MSTIKMRVAIDCDDAATDLKNLLYEALQDSERVEIVDLNYTASKEAHYPEIGHNLAKKIQSGEFDRGILLCGTGLGMSIVANKVEGVYAGLCHDTYSAERLQKSNNAQVITMGARVVGAELAKSIVDSWLNAEFTEGSRSQPKVDQIRELEYRSFHEGG